MAIDPSIARGINSPFAGVPETLNALAQQNDQRQQQQFHNALLTRQMGREDQADQQAQQLMHAKQTKAETEFALQAPDPIAAVRASPHLMQMAQQGGVDVNTLDPDHARQLLSQIHAGASSMLGEGPPQPVYKDVAAGGSLAAIDTTTGKVTNAFSAPPKPEEVPADIQGYKLAQQQGYKGTYTDWTLRKAAAGANNVNVNMKQDTAEAQTVGKGFGEQFLDIQKAGMSSQGKLARLDRIGTLLNGVSTGKLAPKFAELAAGAQSLGITLDPKLGDKQAAEALSNEIALQLRNPSGGAGMPGAMSDSDRNFLASMTPGLAKTPEGNKLIIDTAKKLAQRDQDVAKLARDYRQKHGQMDEGFYNQLDQYSAAHPLFPQAPKAAPAIPEGATATGPGGKRIQMKGGQWVPIG